MKDLVSCIMVTGHQDRGQFPDLAVHAFINQTYRNRELIIINQNPDKPLLRPPAPSACISPAHTYNPCMVREIFRPPSHAQPGEDYSLGGLRNMGLEEARGTWFTSWDDDDFQAPGRLFVMMNTAEPGKALVPTSHIRFSFDTLSAWQYNDAKWGCGGIALYPMTDARFESLPSEEDTQFYLQHFADRRVMWDNSQIADGYLRFYHGKNTGSAKHIMKGFVKEERRWQQEKPGRIRLKAARYLRDVLERKYGVVFPIDMDWYPELNER